MRKILLLSLCALLLAFPALAQSPPAAPTGLETRIQSEIPDKPTYQWQASDGATDYALVVYDATASVIYEASASTGSACAGVICVVSQPVPLARGTYSWKVKAHNDYGYGDYSETLTFSVSQFSIFNLPPLPSPTPVAVQPTPDLASTMQVPVNTVYEYLATAEKNLQQAPDDLSAGTLPNQNGAAVFRYAKWLLSANVGAELFGPFGLTVSHIAAAVGLVIFLATIYFIIFAVGLIIRFVVWIIGKFLDALNALPFIG